MDDADRAWIDQQLRIDVALRTRLRYEPQATGECLNCGERLQDGRWCDADCRHDWELRNAKP